MAVVVILPFAALAFLIRANVSTDLPGEPLLRYVRMNRIVSALVSYDGGGISFKPEATLPDWLDIVIIDTSRQIIFSSLPEYPVGARASLAEELLLTTRNGARNRVIVETLMRDGEPMGAYVGMIKMKPRELADRGSWLFKAIGAYLSLIAAVAVAASVVVGKLGSSVLRLEKAAERITGGDLDTPVPPTGPREIVSLGMALDRMRASLKEEGERRVRFISAVSHDLKTPLTSIAGYIEALEDGLADDAESRARILSVMRAKAGTLDRRVADLLDFAGVSTGEWRARLEDASLRKFLEDLSRGYAEDASLLGLRWESDLGALGDASVPLDRTLASRALENLVFNAFRYCPPGTFIRLYGAVTPEAYVITLSDEGPGILAAELPRIFDPYYRGTPSRREEGSGLGLFIARSIARSHGWAISVDSVPGRGTSFIISIPRIRERG